MSLVSHQGVYPKPQIDLAMGPLSSHVIARSCLETAWSQYRVAQDELVNHILRMAEDDQDVRAFVLALLIQRVGSLKGDDETGVGETSCTDHNLLQQPSVPPGDFSALDDKSTAVVPEDLLIRLMGSSDGVAQDDNNLKLLKRIMRDPKPRTSVVLRLTRMQCNVMSHRQGITSQKVQELLQSDYQVWCGRDVDYLYCPADFATGQIRGYVIFNCRDERTAKRLVEGDESHEKRTECSWANLQGVAENARGYLRRHDRIRNVEYKPFIFRPDDDRPIPLTSEAFRDIDRM